jgi:DNA-binding response OmpR family regulator
MPDKILIVDDEPDILNLARLILEKNGFRVVARAG